MISEGINTILEMKKFSTESSASLTQKMNNLEKLNLVKRHLNREDKRKWNFTLTKKGQTILKKVIKKKEKALNLLFKDFSAKELRTFNKLLEKMEMTLLSHGNFDMKFPCCKSKK
jgi:DNA-binding MarR family transcriptional regulator